MTSGGLAASLGGTGVSGPISESEKASEALSVFGRLKSTRSMVKAMRPGNRRRKWVGEGSRRRRLGRERTAVSKDGKVDQFLE